MSGSLSFSSLIDFLNEFLPKLRDVSPALQNIRKILVGEQVGTDVIDFVRTANLA